MRLTPGGYEGGQPVLPPTVVVTDTDVTGGGVEPAGAGGDTGAAACAATRFGAFFLVTVRLAA